ncbi:MAG: hypothetical protein R2753_11865 [Chitinophagales bacterium]
MTYVGSEDVVINENTCDAASAGTTTVTLTNANGCEYKGNHHRNLCRFSRCSD